MQFLQPESERKGAETPAESQFVLSRIVQPSRPQITA